MAVQRFNVEVGAAFDPTNNPVLYIDGVQNSEYTMSVTTATPGQDVEILDYIVTVPSNASKFVTYTADSGTIGLFLDSNNQPVSKAYLVSSSVLNYVEFRVDNTEIVA